MQLLISTPLQIFTVDLNSGRTQLIRTGDGYYYGISSMGEEIALTSTEGFLGVYKAEKRPIPATLRLLDPHQCEWIDDRILVTNTGNNCLTVFDNDGNFQNDVYLNEVRSDRRNQDRSGNHFNSVHKAGDQVYVVAHNYERPSQVFILSWPGLQVENIITTTANHAHNLWVGECGKVICDSRHGSLYDIVSGETIWQSKEANAFTRGLAVSEQFIIVGYSSKTIRKDRYWTSGGYWIIDRKSLKTVERVVLPGSGQVHEIRILDELDECHNGQMITQGMLAKIRKRSSIVQAAYLFRRKYPVLRKDIPIISQLVRARQVMRSWKSKTV